MREYRCDFCGRKLKRDKDNKLLAFKSIHSEKRYCAIDVTRCERIGNRRWKR